MKREGSRGHRSAAYALIAIAGLLVAGFALAETPTLTPTMSTRPFPNDTGLTLRFTTPAGRMYLKLIRDSIGPAELPVKDARVSALQISTTFEADNVLRVGIRGVGEDLVIYPISSHTFELPADATAFLDATSRQALDAAQLVELGELTSLGLEGWTVQLSGPPPENNAETCGCCSCGSLACCPNSGQCLSCNPCGSCCCASGGGRPKPEHQ